MEKRKPSLDLRFSKDFVSGTVGMAGMEIVGVPAWRNYYKYQMGRE